MNRSEPGRGEFTTRQLHWRVSLLYAAIYLHYGVLAPFMPLWFNHQGVTNERVGILMSLPLFLRILFVAPVTGLADRLRRLREILFLCTLASAILIAGLTQVHSYVGLLIFFTVLSLVWDPLPVLADAYAVASVRARSLDFGRMRVWGSVAFILANVIGGWLVQRTGAGSVPWMVCALLAVPLLVIPLLPADRLLGDPAPMAKGEWRVILRDRALLIGVVGAALIVASHSLLGAFAVIQWTNKGLSGSYIGMLLGISIASELVALWIGQRLLGGRSPLWMVLVGGAVAILRWLLMALDPSPALLVPLQLMQGASSMATIPGLILFMAQRAPAHLASSVQGMNAVVLGVAAALTTLLSGFLWRQLGPASYDVMALVALCGVALTATCLLRMHQGRYPAPYVLHVEPSPVL